MLIKPHNRHNPSKSYGVLSQWKLTNIPTCYTGDWHWPGDAVAFAVYALRGWGTTHGVHNHHQYDNTNQHGQPLLIPPFIYLYIYIVSFKLHWEKQK